MSVCKRAGGACGKLCFMLLFIKVPHQTLHTKLLSGIPDSSLVSRASAVHVGRWATFRALRGC